VPEAVGPAAKLDKKRLCGYNRGIRRLTRLQMLTGPVC